MIKREMLTQLALFPFLSQIGVAILAGIIDPDIHEESGLLLHSRGTKQYTWHSSDPVGYLLGQNAAVETVAHPMNPPFISFQVF